MILFSDTHLFLHFRDPAELPWRDVTASDTIVLAVGRTIQKELEQKRYELRGRPQDRARKYVRMLGDIAVKGEQLVLREEGPRILLDFVPRQAGWMPPSDLDPTWQDDQFIADVLSYAHHNPGAEISVLTDDPGAIAVARAHHLNVVRPGDEWALPAEPTPETRELQKLRQENAELKRTGPTIVAALYSAEGEEPIEKIEVSAAWHPPLTAAVANSIVEEVLAAHPEATSFDRTSDGEPATPLEWEMPSEKAVVEYMLAHREWRHKVRVFVEEFAKQDTRAMVGFDFRLELRNAGVEPAVRTRVVIEVAEGFLLAEPPREGRKRSLKHVLPPGDRLATAQSFEPPPRAPMPRRRASQGIRLRDLKEQRDGSAAALDMSRFRGLMPQASDLYGVTARNFLGPAARVEAISHDLLRPQMPAPADPQDFLWVTSFNERHLTREWEFACEEFPHQSEPVTLPFRLMIPLSGPPARRGHLNLRISASNLRKPFEVTRGIEVNIGQEDTMARVRSLLR